MHVVGLGPLHLPAGRPGQSRATGAPPCSSACILGRTCRGAQSEVIRAILLPVERVAPQSEVIRAIVLEDGPCRGGWRPHPSLWQQIPVSGML